MSSAGFCNPRRHSLKPDQESIVTQYVTEFGRDVRAEPDGRLDAPAFHRNHQPIWTELERYLAGKSRDVLEAGSGTGQQVAYFGRQTPRITWRPSELSAQHLTSIA